MVHYVEVRREQGRGRAVVSGEEALSDDLGRRPHLPGRLPVVRPRGGLGGYRVGRERGAVTDAVTVSVEAALPLLLQQDTSAGDWRPSAAGRTDQGPAEAVLGAAGGEGGAAVRPLDVVGAEGRGGAAPLALARPQQPRPRQGGPGEQPRPPQETGPGQHR